MATPPSPSPASAAPITYEQLPLRDIPGSYGLPLLGSIKDRLDYFWFQGQKEFWASRKLKFKSTVFRTNVPPSPPAFAANNVIMLLDQKSFPVLFDTTKVYKKDILLANYMPHTSYFGGIRPCVYLDPSEERHAKLKSFIMHLLKARSSRWVPEMQTAMNEIFATWEAKLAENPEGFSFSSETGQVALNVLIRTLLNQTPSTNELSPTTFQIWLAPQLLPFASVGLPHLLEELILHNIRIPFLLVAFFYKKIETFFRKHAVELIDEAEKQFGIERDDALHNMIFFTGFNAFGGLNILLPWIVSYVGMETEEVKAEMAREVREAVRAEGGKLTARAIMSRMPLVRSAVYEVLRMEPPVPYQYGVAKMDMVIESHEARFEVKKGEVIGGCQPVAERDPVVFGDSAERFEAGRFVGEGEKLLKYVLWGNGPANGETSVGNKQCAANELVPLLGQAFLASIFLKYNSFSTLAPVVKGDSVTHKLASLTPSSSSSSSSSS